MIGFSLADVYCHKLFVQKLTNRNPSPTKQANKYFTAILQFFKTGGNIKLIIFSGSKTSCDSGCSGRMSVNSNWFSPLQTLNKFSCIYMSNQSTTDVENNLFVFFSSLGLNYCF